MKKPELKPYVGKEVVMGIRPEDIHAEEAYLAVSEKANIQAHVDLAEMMGSEIYLYLTYNEQKIVARVPSRTGIKADDTARLAVDTEKLHIFNPDTQEIICH